MRTKIDANGTLVDFVAHDVYFDRSYPRYSKRENGLRGSGRRWVDLFVLVAMQEICLAQRLALCPQNGARAPLTASAISMNPPWRDGSSTTKPAIWRIHALITGVLTHDLALTTFSPIRGLLE
jgi:hypothetical protein